MTIICILIRYRSIVMSFNQYNLDIVDAGLDRSASCHIRGDHEKCDSSLIIRCIMWTAMTQFISLAYLRKRVFQNVKAIRYSFRSGHVEHYEESVVELGHKEQ